MFIFQVRPLWTDEKVEAWKELALRWMGKNEAFNDVSSWNKANRGTEGTHNAGNRNHDRFKAKMVFIYPQTTCIYFLSFTYLITVTSLSRCSFVSPT
jgi:hypothetical protein